MERGLQVLLLFRVLPCLLFGFGRFLVGDRFFVPGLRSAAFCPLRGQSGFGGGGLDRRGLLDPAAPALKTPARAFRESRRGRGRPPAARVRGQIPSAAAPPRERPGRHLLPPQPNYL